MKKTLPYYMMLALHDAFDMKGLRNEVEVSNSVMGWMLFTLQLPGIDPIRLVPIHNMLRFQRMLGVIPDALRKWAEDDTDIKRILVEVEL